MANNKLNTWEKICKKKGLSPVIPFDVSMLDKATQNYLIAAYKLPIIIEVRNEGWVPDYTPDNNQIKYELWPDVIADKERPSGFGLSYYGYDCWRSYSIVGVRFCFKDSATAKSTFHDFKEDFEHYLLKIG